ncbi:acyltransferase family protein [Mucilaginibacter sp. HD30]
MISKTDNINRDYLIDNLKSVLICCVVIGHFIEPYIHQAAYFEIIFVCIYSFHMPVFVFLSGYLSKSNNSISAYKMVTTLLIPYIIFSSLWHLRENIHTRTLDFDLLSPTFHLWYLLSLFSWKLLLPVVQTIKHYVIVCFTISLAVGLSPAIGNTASLGRTFSLLPFFVLGTVCSSSVLHTIHKRKYLAVAGLITICTIAYVVAFYHPNYRIIGWTDPYHFAGYSNSSGLFIRLMLMIVSALIGIAVITLTPARKIFFTALGARTLTVYIFHGFLVKSFSVRFPIWHQSVLNDLIIIAFPILLIPLLSLPIVSDIYHKVMNYIAQKLTNAVH